MPQRVCFIADYSNNADEGMKKTALELTTRLEETCESIRIRSIDALNPFAVRRIRKFKPHIIHYFHGPTIVSLIGLRFLKTITGSQTVISATHPRVPIWLNKLHCIVEVDMILAQSAHSKERIAPLAKMTVIIPSGVDIDIFKPVTRAERDMIRDDLGINPSDSVGLHAGSIVQSRNLELVMKAKKHLDHMIVVGSTSTPVENSIVGRLKDSGCRVIHSYIPDIHRYYQAADVYIFPTNTLEGSIDFPLSVLEALATGLPVLAYPSQSLVDAFGESDGIVFIDDSTDFATALKKAKSDHDSIRQRKKVNRYTWDRIAESVLDAYGQLNRRGD